MASPALLLLEDEEPFRGTAMGHEGIARGMVVTSALAAGFPDLLTDPSYGGKLVCFTYPHVGNAGVVPAELQSSRPAARAVIAREISKIKANRLGTETMNEFLVRHRIPAMEGADTRTIAEIAARRGLVRAVLGCGEFADAGLLRQELARGGDAWRPEPAGTDAPYDWRDSAVHVPQCYTVVVHDFGVKRGFLRRLSDMGCAVKVVPFGQPAAVTLEAAPDAVVFSAGPGVPEAYPEALRSAGGLIGKVPLWGVGVGAGVLAFAEGARTVVNGRGRYGIHAVGRPGGASGEMTCQAREFWIEAESLPEADLETTHFHLDEGTAEGFMCRKRKLMGTLFHPESEPGPRDSLYLFDRFHEMMRR